MLNKLIKKLPYFGIVQFDGFKMKSYGRCLESEFFYSNLFSEKWDFEINERRELLQILKGVDVFIDIGANTGYYSLLAASMKVESVYAFEPEYNNFKLLINNVLINNFDIICIPFGCGKKEELLEFYVGEDYSHRYSNSFNRDFSSARYKKISSRTKIAVPGDWLINFISQEKKILIKIDVEGYENSVVPGIAGLMSREIKPSLLIETEDINLIEDISKKFGYKIISLSGENIDVKNYLLVNT